MHKKEFNKKKLVILAAVSALLVVVIASCSSEKEPIITNQLGIFKLKQLSYKIDAGERMVKSAEKSCLAFKEKGCEDRIEKMKEGFEENIKKERKAIYEQFGDK